MGYNLEELSQIVGGILSKVENANIEATNQEAFVGGVVGQIERVSNETEVVMNQVDGGVIKGKNYVGGLIVISSRSSALTVFATFSRNFRSELISKRKTPFFFKAPATFLNAAASFCLGI